MKVVRQLSMYFLHKRELTGEQIEKLHSDGLLDSGLSLSEALAYAKLDVEAQARVADLVLKAKRASAKQLRRIVRRANP